MSFPAPTPSQRPHGVTPRQKYRSMMAKRQATVYGFTITALAVIAAIALLGLSGIVKFPFPEEFSHAEVYAEAGETPCPVDIDSFGPPAPGTRLQVLNSSSLPGGAATLAERLAGVGYEISLVDNGQPYKGKFLIEAGPNGVDSAYSIAQFFGPDTQIRLANTSDRTVTVTIGEAVEELPSPESMQEVVAAGARIVPLPECINVDPASVGNVAPDQGQSGSPQSAEEPPAEEAPPEEPAESEPEG